MSDRREFIQNLIGGTIAGLPAVKSAEVLRLTPKDILVLTCDQHISYEQARRLKELLKRELPPYQKCLVLGKGLDIKVIRESE